MVVRVWHPKVKTKLFYTVSSRPAWVTYKNPVLGKDKRNYFLKNF